MLKPVSISEHMSCDYFITHKRGLATTLPSLVYGDERHVVSSTRQRHHQTMSGESSPRISEPTQGTVRDAAHFELQLHEDIGAEIEDIILLRRLGFPDEVLDIIDNVLWRHAALFPVFAEVSAFLCERGDGRRLRKLVDDVLKTNLYARNFKGNEWEFFEFVVECIDGRDLDSADILRHMSAENPIEVWTALLTSAKTDFSSSKSFK